MTGKRFGAWVVLGIPVLLLFAFWVYCNLKWVEQGWEGGYIHSWQPAVSIVLDVWVSIALIWFFGFWFFQAIRWAIEEIQK